MVHHASDSSPFYKEDEVLVKRLRTLSRESSGFDQRGSASTARKSLDVPSSAPSATGVFPRSVLEQATNSQLYALLGDVASVLQNRAGPFRKHHSPSPQCHPVMPCECWFQASAVVCDWKCVIRVQMFLRDRGVKHLGKLLADSECGFRVDHSRPRCLRLEIPVSCRRHPAGNQPRLKPCPPEYFSALCT